MTWRTSLINVATQPGGGAGAPGAQPPISIDFSASTIGTAILTSSSRGYRTTAKTVASTGGARFHAGTDGVVKGILLERATTGWLRNNDDFSTAHWAHKDMTQASATQASIFGTNTAYKFTETATATTHNINRGLGQPEEIADNLPICIWAIVEHVDMPYVMLMFKDKANRFPWQRFNIHPDSSAVGAAFPGSATQYNAGIEYFGGNRHVIWATYSASSATIPVNPAWHLFSVNAAGDSHSYAGTGRSFIVHAGGATTGFYPPFFFQVGDEHRSVVGDTLTLGVENQATNDFYVNVPFYATAGAQRYLYQSGDFSIRVSDDAIYASFGANQVAATHTFVRGGYYNVAVGKGPTQGLAIYVNGALLAQDSTAPFRADINPGTIYIGSDSAGGNQIDGVIEKLVMGVWE